MPDKCLKCGAAPANRIHRYHKNEAIEYACGTQVYTRQSGWFESKDCLRRQLATAEKRIVALEEAIKPFAALWAAAPWNRPPVPRDDYPVWAVNGAILRVGDFRKVAALDQKPKSEPPEYVAGPPPSAFPGW